MNNFFSSIPKVTKNLIIINVIAYLASLALPRVGIDVLNLLGMHYYGADAFSIYQMLTYMFLHSTSGFGHLFFNMFALYMFGGLLERVWGAKRFLIYYIITGVGAGIIQQIVWALTTAPSLPVFYHDLLLTIGASGAIFGILLAFGMMFPNMPLFIMFIPIPVKAKYVVIGYGILELLAGIAGRAGDNVAHFAHLGGMLFGLVLILLWRKKHGRDQLY
ncbi:rhomboid family intramembrane serine protease [Porphyromonas sp.]|uniref:rhomboid family intramembrane serine protease n=1 Tax=Porphyromonas sp. TaxID=1924944 RepID=UPI0026DBECBD|nr:rhomboid family intramembrane serine protease [Porphyromonas sp.]MDO4695165.1 rhomboid family intramembrane serine protease [Porphyromonas sp.]MDO4770911.1 rhomboid family intramembrane serine protease [Porphyromonas sp.]